MARYSTIHSLNLLQTAKVVVEDLLGKPEILVDLGLLVKPRRSRKRRAYIGNQPAIRYRDGRAVES
jgi:hypothetical protein